MAMDAAGPQGPVLPVHEVVAIVQEWVDREASGWPDFAGAYLWGGITALPADAPFALYRDLDVVIVLTAGAPEEEREAFYRGISLEIICKNLDEHQDAQATLANPSAGPNLAVTRILADPTGAIGRLQQAVAAEFGQRRWVQARCAGGQRRVDAALAEMRQAATPGERFDAVRGYLNALSGMLAVAELARPTTRRTLALLHALLAGHGRADLHEAALGIMGSAALDAPAVERLLDRTIAAFDRAAAVNRTPIPYGFTIQPHLRPYYLEGSREMIAEGLHREAVFWIGCLDVAYVVLANDAPEAEQPGFAAELSELYALLGYDSATAWTARLAAAERLAAEIGLLAAKRSALHPDAAALD